MLAHDAVLLERWDHTASIQANIYNLTTVVVNAASGKSKLKPRSPLDFHPYRSSPRKGLRITPENAKSTLWMLGNLIAAK